MAGVSHWVWASRLLKQSLRPLPRAREIRQVSDRAQVAGAADGARDRVAAFYRARSDKLGRDRDQATLARAQYLRWALASCFAIALLLVLSLGTRLLPIWPAALPLIPAIFSLERARRWKRRTRHTDRLLDLYERRLARVRHQWMGKGDPGLDLEMPAHLSARDLDLFGDGSMFELLCDVDTPAGRETLAKWLQFPAPIEDVISRQQSIDCLRDRADLRERLTLLRDGEASEYSWSKLREWLIADPVALPGWAPWCALFLSLAMIIACACWGAGLLQAAAAIWVIAGIAVLESALSLLLRGRIGSILANLHLPARKVDSLRRLCALLEGERFESSRLLELQNKVEGSSKRIASLERLLRLLDLRNNEWFIWPFLLLLGTIQVTSQIERWRLRHGRELVEWINVLGEFEALMAVANYAYENPDDCFPELVEGGPLFEATEMGHPLMDIGACVRNDIKINGETQFLVVTGSNMSGKSTLLRTVGLNATLAWMGAPVKAAQLHVSPLQVCASIRIEDSLLKGASRFYAEVQRLKAMLDRGSSGPPVLFLIDELFGGTNSADRRVAAEALIRSLVERQSIGLVTSHDMALSEIGEMPELKGANVHFTDLPTGDRLMAFDYRIHPGKLEHGNALKILKLVGIPGSVDGAELRVLEEPK